MCIMLRSVAPVDRRKEEPPPDQPRQEKQQTDLTR